jgi:hypothetical protein
MYSCPETKAGNPHFSSCTHNFKIKQIIAKCACGAAFAGKREQPSFLPNENIREHDCKQKRTFKAAKDYLRLAAYECTGLLIPAKN